MHRLLSDSRPEGTRSYNYEHRLYGESSRRHCKWGRQPQVVLANPRAPKLRYGTGLLKRACLYVSFGQSIHMIVSSADDKKRMDRFFAAHRESGLPVTTQRRAVFEAIANHKDHPTAEQLYSEVRRELPQISRMTVHRILGAFVSLGLVARTCHPGSAARFDPRVAQHHHLVCLDCGRIVDVEDRRLNGLPWPNVNPQEFQIQDYHVHFRGRCSRCRRNFRAFQTGGKRPGRLSLSPKRIKPGSKHAAP